MIAHQALVAPREHLGILSEPGAEEIQAALAARPDPRLERLEWLDRPLGAWRSDLRARLGLAGPVIATGHQVEFFHAGVLAKNIAAQLLARQTGGTALFISVDSDLPKAARLVVPEITAGGLRRVEVDLPGCELQQSAECQPNVPRGYWLDFFVRVATLYEHYDASLLREFSEAWLAAGDPVHLVAAMERCWTAVEEALEVGGIRRVRQSQLCETPEFRAFFAHLACHAPRLVQAHNRAQAAYRQRHGIRSRQQPVPPLATGPRTELPFWAYRCGGPRQRVYVEQRSGRLTIYAGDARLADGAGSELAAPEAVARPWPFELSGWHLRPRALAVSAFARLLLADLFIHGIGGARYDEITDEFLTEFLGAPPPPFCCLSATVHLPLPRTGVKRSDLLAARHAARDLRWNPQRHLPQVPEDLARRRQALVRRSDELRRQSRADRSERRLVFEEIRHVSAQMLAVDPWRPAELDGRIAELEQRLELERIATDREYFAALHPRRVLAELVGRIAGRLERPGAVPGPRGSVSRTRGA